MTVSEEHAVLYLSMGDIARELDVDVATVSKWRDRHDDFPAPDIRLGRRGGWPGWHPDRLPEIANWRSHRLDRGGRPRHISVDEAHQVGLPLAEWVTASEDPRQRTKRLVRVEKAAENRAAFAALLAEVGLDHPDEDLMRPGGYARGLILTATLEHIAQLRPGVEFAPRR